MRFGDIPVGQSAGALLAHSLKHGRLRLKKGHRLTAENIAALEAEGIEQVTVLRLGDDDVPENQAAATLGAALSGSGLRIGEAGTGRVNILADSNGLFRADRAAIDEFNRIDPAITFACLGDRRQVAAGEMVATIKIIPLAVVRSSLDAALQIISRPHFIAVKAFAPWRVALIATMLPALKASVMDKTRDLLAERLRPSGSRLVGEVRVEHRREAVAESIRTMAGEADMLVVFGASAVIDPGDVIPAAIRMAGGSVEAVGMPVDPGNLLVLGRLNGKPVIGAPGCARSPKENGFDWVLARLLAGEAVTRAELTGMGVGGLLTEIATRPQPREKTCTTRDTLRVEAVVLAAGRASRMKGAHKLLAEFDGMPLVRSSVEQALHAPVDGVKVVIGHRGGEIVSALEGLECEIVANPDHATGMASSLAAGIAALQPRTAGALVMLADMPAIRSEHLAKLVSVFHRKQGKAIVRAAHGTHRGNPVLLPRAVFAAVEGLSGDVGARHVIEASGLPIVDVDIGEAACLDVDTIADVEAAGGVLRT